MARLFGTDGVRGIAGEFLTPSLGMKIGVAAATILTKNNKKNVKIIIGNDGRVSADMLVSALTAGLCSVGVDVMDLGMIPTPAVSYLIKYYHADAGIMVTASHNSYEYNGIKIFNENGYKLADELEDEIEEFILNDTQMTSTKIGTKKEVPEGVDVYVNHLLSAQSCDMSSLHIAVDTANGAASFTASRLFSKLGIKYDIINNNPNGTNINENCGSLHIDSLGKYVKDHHLDCGVAFDGDSDRAIFVDENGSVIDGDYVLAILGLDLKNNGKLKNNTIVGTIMNNLGFVKFCEENNIDFIATKVGDRYVLEEMNINSLSLGGEQSGHIIIKEFANTGDGELTAVNVLNCLAKSGKKLSELAGIMKKYPQVMQNVKINTAKKNEFYTNETIKNEIEKVTNLLSSRGRIVVRPSGTEPLIRVMIEGEDIAEIKKYVSQLANVIEKELN